MSLLSSVLPVVVVVDVVVSDAIVVVVSAVVEVDVSVVVGSTVDDEMATAKKNICTQ